MASNELQIIISAIDKASGKLSKIGKTGSTVFKALGIAAGAAMAGFASLSTVLIKSAEKTKIQEDAERILSVALQNLGIDAKKTMPDLKSFASGLQQVTTFGDESILKMQSLLVSLGGLTGEGLKKTTKATLDLAQGLGIDLRTAALLMGKAAAGETTTLTRYGLVIEKGKDKAETFSNVLSAVNKKFSGAAQKAALDYSGRVKQVSNSFGDLQETIGQTLTKSGAIAALQKALIGLFNQFSTTLQNNKSYYLDLVKNGIIVFLEALGNIARVARFVGRVFEILAAGISKSFSFILGGIKTLLEGFAKVADFTGFDAMATKARNLAREIGFVSEGFSGAAADIFENGSWITDTLDTIISTTDTLAMRVEEANSAIVETLDTRAETISENLDLEKEQIGERYDYELERLAGLETRVQNAFANMALFELVIDKQKRIEMKKRDKKQEKQEKKERKKRGKAVETEVKHWIKWDLAKRAVFTDTMGRIGVMMNDLATLTGKKTKEMFAIQKAAAIAQAIINIEEAATKAWAQGGMFGAIMAGIVLAAGAVHIAAIAAQKMAKGGIVTQPTVALIGEAGPEKVIPLDRADEFDTQQQPIVINFNGPIMGDEEQAREFAIAIDEELYNLKTEGQSLAFEGL